MMLLGVETSCDDTAAALVRDGRDVLSVGLDQPGCVSREVRRYRPGDRRRAATSRCSRRPSRTRSAEPARLETVDGIAVTRGPGLIGSLVVGVAAAKALAFALDKPLYGVNHLHGHIFAPFLDRPEAPPYPFLALLVSGGHSQLVAVESPTALRVVGRTRDDAAGEAFDKTARLLGLPYPGGPNSIAWRSAGNRGPTPFRAISRRPARSIFRFPD